VNVRGSGWRTLAYGGARYGPRWWVEHSPAFFGALFACLLPRERARVRDGLRLILGERPRFSESVDILSAFVAYAHCLAESLAVERPEAQSAEPWVHGAEHLQRALGGGRGAVIVTAHTGAWDATARWLARDYGVDLLVVMAAEADERSRALQDGLRAQFGVRVAHVGAHPLDALPVLRHLRRGGVVAAQLDRVVNQETAVEVGLGGHPFAVPAGPFHLARLARVPVLPVFARRLGYFRYEIDVLEPILVSGGSGPAGVTRAAATAAVAMGGFLRKNPTQWFHFSR